VWVGNKDGSAMKWVSGASGAGEIFKNIVYFLEKWIIIPNIVSLENTKKEYVEITSPLPRSIFKIDSSKPLESQAIGLKVSTNIDHAKEIWKVNGAIYKKDFLPLKKWYFTIQVELFNEKNESVWSNTSQIEIQEDI
jgi:membrane carboxypeptidase/penicillin-binding protein PbpC